MSLISKEFFEKQQRQQTERSEKEYFPIRNLGLVLLEIFPTERRDALVDGLRKLMGSDVPMISPGMSGVLGAEWFQRIGLLVNADTPSEYLDAPEKQLPEPFAAIELTVGQCYSSSYYVLCQCYIRSTFQDQIKDEFVVSRSLTRETIQEQGRTISITKPKGPEREPRIRQYQRQMETFLSQFIPGMFLSQKTTGKLRCPSARILAAEKIEFEEFGTWFSDHFAFFEFLGSYGPVVRVDSFLVGYQDDRLWTESGIFGGLNFICSESHFKATATHERTSEEIIRHAAWFFMEEITRFFVALYWAVSRLESGLFEWEGQVRDLENDLASLLAPGAKASLDSVKELYRRNIRLLNAFEEFAIDEETNIRSMERGLFRRGRPKSEPLEFWKVKLDVLADIGEAAERFLREEQGQVQLVRHKIQNISEQCGQYTDFALQTSMHRLTLVAVALAIVALIVASWSQILSFLTWLASVVN